MKVAIVAIGRLENKYIRDFCNYYKNLGVDNIILGDNNHDEDNEYFEDVIYDYIRTGFVILKNLRNLKVNQMGYYRKMILEYYQYFDWILVIDIDEFLFIDNFNNIKDFLSQDIYQKFSFIKINWMIYGDSGKLYYENIPIYERLYQPAKFNIIHKLKFFNEETEIFGNSHVKSIVHTSLFKFIGENINQLNFSSPHSLNVYPCCDVKGNLVNTAEPYVHPPIFEGAHIKHYITKTISEFLDIKCKRGYPDGTNINKEEIENYFFNINEWTQEKQDIIDNYKLKNKIN